MKEKRIAILLGDPTGIGPELVVKVLAQLHVQKEIQYVIIGDERIYNQACDFTHTSVDYPLIKEIKSEISDDDIVLYDYPTISTEEYRVGELNLKGGISVVKTLQYTVELVKKKLIHGAVFAPFNKQAMHEGGLPFNSELEYFKDTFSIANIPGELNILDNFWTMRVTSHVALKDVSALLTIENIENAIRFLDTQLNTAGKEHALIAVAGLNPHNGEHGLFGREEADVIEPAINIAQRKGINVIGPYPADTLFLRLQKEHIEGIVCMYHDQAQIGLKLLGFDRGVTLMAGLPVPICTPAHGTAFDIAGKNKAFTTAFYNAVILATTIVRNSM